MNQQIERRKAVGDWLADFTGDDGCRGRMKQGGRLIYVGRGRRAAWPFGRFGMSATFRIDPSKVVGVIAGGPERCSISKGRRIVRSAGHKRG